MDIIQKTIVESATRPVNEVLRDLVCGKPSAEALELLRSIITTGVIYDEQLTEIVSAAWGMIRTRELWKARFDSLEALEKLVNYRAVIDPIIQRHSRNDRRKLSEMKKITDEWKTPFAAALPQLMQPDNWSKALLIALRELSCTVDLETGIQLLQKAIDSREATRSRSHEANPQVTIRDVQGILHDQLTNARLLPETSPFSSDSSHNDIPRSTRSTRAVARANQARAGSIRQERRVIIAEADTSEEDEAIAAQDEPSPMRKGRKASLSKSSPLCGCKIQCDRFSARVPEPGTRLDPGPALELLITTRIHWESFCKNHLRRLAGGCAGLYTNKGSTRKILINRMKIVVRYGSRDHLSKVHQRFPQWFRRSERAANLQDFLGFYMYQPTYTMSFHFDPKDVFNRYAQSETAWDDFHRDGTINVDGFFDHLVSPEAFKLVEEEFDLYKYHLRDEVNGQARRGWMRHMFYSLTQQLVRQDPAYWAIMAAARPDQQWRLISYPYYTKDTSEGESTGFAHLDINVEKFIATGRGANIIQGSLSLDDEGADGCTLLVPGFHRHVASWWERVKARGQNRCGYTTNANTIYTPDDEKTFGNLTPVPCKRGTIRITRPEIVHGSTNQAKRRRRTVFVWHYGIREDHETLDLEEAERWSDLVRCHQALEVPQKSTSGEGFRYGRPSFLFPGVSKLQSTSMVGDAMVGARRWDDPQVITERNLLLGSDAVEACRRVKEIRERLVSEFLRVFPFIERAESEAYQERSFFRRQGAPRPSPDQDAVSDLSSSISEISVTEGGLAGDSIDGNEGESEDVDEDEILN